MGEVRSWLLDRVPGWFRTRWPMRRYYWQAEQLASIPERVAARRARMGLDDAG